MKIGLIGCGGMGATHNNALKALSETTKIEVSAIADLREDFLNRAAKSWPEAKLYSEAANLIKNETLDAVHICPLSYLHADTAVSAMKKGMNVFVEKPVCLTEEDCEKLLSAEKETGKYIMVGQVVRFFKEYAFLKKVISEKRYGELKSLVMKRIACDVSWGFEDWFHDKKKSGSVVMDLHIHDVDFLRYALGEPESFSVVASAFKSGMVNHIITTYKFGGAFVTAEGIWDESDKITFEATYRACFERATVELTKDGKVAVYEKGRVVFPELTEERGGKDDSAGINITDQGPYYAEIKDFYACIAEGKPLTIAPLSEGVKSVRLGLKELEAAKKFING